MNRILTMLFALKNDIVFLYKTLLDRHTERKMRCVIVALFLYVVFPVDIVSDFFPVIGWVDDLAIVLIVTKWLKNKTHPL
jgi:uncharacterized membrane protein YkvA (DUF1232 family)